MYCKSVSACTMSLVRTMCKSVRGLQGRTVTKQQQADGRQSQQQRLHNITEDDAGHFDVEWTYEAERSLPMYMRNNRAALPQASRTNRPPAVGW